MFRPTRSLLLIALWGAALSGCAKSTVVHLQTVDARAWGVDTAWRTTKLTANDPQFAGLGGTRLDGTLWECPPGFTATDITVCVGDSLWCAKQVKTPPTEGITVFYHCAVPNPAVGGGLGAVPVDN